MIAGRCAVALPGAVENMRCTRASWPGFAITLLEIPLTPDIMAATVEAYCVKCKAKRNMKDPKENTMANGRKAMKGTCPTCGTGMFKILGKA